MTRTATSLLEEVIDELDEVQQTGPGQWKARCPAHDDTNPSLSVAEGEEKPVVLNCHRGCDFQDIAGELESMDLSWDAFGDEAEQVAVYPYHNRDANVEFEVVRFELTDQEHPAYPDKTFRQRVPGEGWSVKTYGREYLLYRRPRVVSAVQEGNPVFLVEGEKDVHTAEDLGFVATCNPMGAGSWKDKYTSTLSGAHVIILPDNDAEGREHAREVAGQLLPVAKSVRIVKLPDLPQKGDLSDWVDAGGTAEELKRLAKETTTFQPSENGNEDVENASEEGSTYSWKAIRAEYESESAKEARVRAANRVIQELDVATNRESGNILVWDPEDRVMDTGGEQRIGELLVRTLQDKHSQHEQNEITEKVRLLTARDEFGGEFIPVANGDLFLNPLRLKDADPKRAPLTRSNASWDPDADCTFFKGHLEGVVPAKRERETLQEYVGYCLLHWDIPFHKALFMVGPTASGKSTTLNVIRKLLGSVSKLSPQQLVNGRFGPAELEGSWANIRSDISAALLQDIGLFKEVVAGDPIFVERKHEQGYTLRPTAKHVYSANQLPDVAIDDDAFYRRILLVSFPTTIPREDRINRADLDECLEEELDGILRWAVNGLQRVLEQGGFTHDLSPQQTRHRWEEHASSIGRFKAVALDITGDSNDVVAKERVFSAYTQFCKDHGLGTETKQQLTRTLKRDPRITDGHRTPTGHSQQVRCYVGVEIDEDAF